MTHYLIVYVNTDEVSDLNGFGQIPSIPEVNRRYVERPDYFLGLTDGRNQDIPFTIVACTPGNRNNDSHRCVV